MLTFLVAILLLLTLTICAWIMINPEQAWGTIIRSIFRNPDALEPTDGFYLVTRILAGIVLVYWLVRFIF